MTAGAHRESGGHKKTALPSSTRGHTQETQAHGAYQGEGHTAQGEAIQGAGKDEAQEQGHPGAKAPTFKAR